MSKAVVKPLKVVHVNEQECELILRVSARSCNSTSQAIKEQSPIGKVRERIVECAVAQLCFGAFAFGDVAVYDDQLRMLTFICAHYARDRFENPPSTIFVTDSVFQMLGSFASTRAIDCFRYGGSIMR